MPNTALQQTSGLREVGSHDVAPDSLRLSAVTGTGWAMTHRHALRSRALAPTT
jgi:hypothetical protein